MNATTMQEAGRGEEQPKGPDPLVNLLRNVWWAGLGLVALAGEQGGKLVKTAVERGRTVEPGVREELKKVNEAASARLKGLGESVGRRAGKIEKLVDERISKTISGLTAPLEEELKAIGRRMEELADKVEQLRQQRSAGAEPEA